MLASQVHNLHTVEENESKSKGTEVTREWVTGEGIGMDKQVKVEGDIGGIGSKGGIGAHGSNHKITQSQDDAG